jgi:beta-N-acetylhexosaminidase
MRRRVRLAGLAAAAAAIVLAALLAFGGSGRQSGRGVLPEGGSAFRAAAAQTVPRHAPRLADRPDPGGLPAPAVDAAARLFLVGFGGPHPSARVLRRLAQHEWGGVVLGAGNGTSPQQVAGLVGRLRGAAAQAHHPAPLIAASQPGGDGDAVPVGLPPEPIVPDAATAQRDALAAARALRALGIRLVLAPDADVGTAGGPWAGRAFSDDPPTVAKLAAAAVDGYTAGGVAAAPGHFPGEGGASGDPAVAPATVGLSLGELRRRDVQAFAAVAGRAPAMQLSAATYVAFDGVTPATLLPEVVRMLRGDLHFGGVIVSGDLAAASLATGQPVADLAVDALKAGCDLLWVPGDAADQDAAWQAVARALRTGEVPAARVTDALRRVSLLRARYGVA